MENCMFSNGACSRRVQLRLILGQFEEFGRSSIVHRGGVFEAGHLVNPIFLEKWERNSAVELERLQMLG